MTIATCATNTIPPAQLTLAVHINPATRSVLPKVIPKDSSSSKIQSPVVISKVITEQPKKTLDKYLMGTNDKYAEHIEKLQKPNKLRTDASLDTEVKCRGIADVQKKLLIH